ncbi:YqeG family HAD IIIA-type phosphatase [Alicyclobacillus shizuokensis]|uniref:YqeG family HAD IIIA-type phosphatase n=1 Tax=Alicyclobacillus shizuokensis TaxID=392014 RepID=UPI000834E87F|nr:YqeG family HAD IIIA-type phosphatase [Alicyclobacillus shizuokensis]MCL6627498.1 YqeG family HAD IIIA-type phosphatase [Alicyclobacillus shizuokensis]
MRNLWMKLMPDEYVSSVYAIDLDKLRDGGRRLLLSDLDNTLVPWNDEVVPAALAAWYRRVVEAGMDLCIVSNNRGPRVSEFARQLGARAIPAAKKPRPQAFLAAMASFDVAPEQTVMVGDQLFTDIRGARRLGIYTILVLPVSHREWWGTRLTRLAERAAFKVLERHGLVRPIQEGGRE